MSFVPAPAARGVRPANEPPECGGSAVNEELGRGADRALGHADQRMSSAPSSCNASCTWLICPRPPSINSRSGCGTSPSRIRVAPRERLPQRAVVIARRHAGDVEAAILLERAFGSEHDTGCDGIFPVWLMSSGLMRAGISGSSSLGGESCEHLFEALLLREPDAQPLRAFSSASPDQRAPIPRQATDLNRAST